MADPCTKSEVSSVSRCGDITWGAKFYFTRFNQSLLDFFNLVDLRLILMPMRESLKLHERGSLLNY